LRCSSNQLTNLNVSGCTALSTFDCSDNSLTNLNVSDNTALTGLGCSTNYLSSLNVSANKALTSLYCNGNQLTNLYVKNGKNQQMYFDATDNPNLTCIEVDDSARSSVYWRDKKDATAFFSEHCSETGINTIAQSKAPQVYPNPTTGNIYFSVNANIVLTDFLGNLHLEQKNTNQLDISALPAGMYFLRVGDNLKQIFKIIKE
jgi:Leucine-rich repeat (LRR) protein